MPTQLVRACVLLAVAAGATLAADPPKGKKEKPTPPAVVEEFNKPGDVPGDVSKYAAPHPLDVAKTADTKFVVTKPIGTWVRDVQLKEGAVRIRLTITDDRFTFKVEMAGGQAGCILTESCCVQIDADYSINKESCLFGVIDAFGTDQPLTDDAAKLLKLSGQPFSVRFRADEQTLSLKDFKGFGVGVGSYLGEGMSGLLLAVCGQYTAFDPAKPLPALKASNKNVRGSDPLIRQDQLLNQSETFGPIGETPLSPRPMTPPDVPRPERIHGGILKADPPKEVEGGRLGGVPYPTPHYLKHYPQYFAPDPAFPLQKERDSMLDPDGNIRRGSPDLLPTTSAYVGSVNGAAAMLVQAKAAVVTAPHILPAVALEMTSTCDPPTDAEVMAAFGERAKAFGEDITIVKNNLAETIDAPRLYPLVGMARTHCCQWECSVYFNDPSGGSRKPKVEVIRLDTQKMRMLEPQGEVSIPQRMLEK